MNDDAISAGRTAAFLNRMLAVFFVTLLCLMLQSYGANLADILTAIITGTSGMRPGSSLMQYATSAFAGSAGFLLFQIGWILLARLMLFAFAIFTEWKGITGKRPYLVAWTIAGIASSPLILPFGGLVALSILPKILIMAASGHLYWWLIGRRPDAACPGHMADQAERTPVPAERRAGKTDWTPYALSVDTSWSADGTDLLSVDLIYLSL